MVIIADLIAASLQVECVVFRSTNIAETCGVGIDVPQLNLNIPVIGVEAVMICSPGAIMSGYKNYTTD